MDFKQVVTIINQIAKERNIDAGKVLEAIEDSIATAYRKEYGERGEVIKAKINAETGEAKFWQVKEVVDESTVRIVPEGVEDEVVETKEDESDEPKLPRYNPERHIFISEAKAIKADVVLGDKLEFPLEAKVDFGRIAAQSAKQVVLQKFRKRRRRLFSESSVTKKVRSSQASFIASIEAMSMSTSDAFRVSCSRMRPFPESIMSLTPECASSSSPFRRIGEAFLRLFSPVRILNSSPSFLKWKFLRSPMELLRLRPSLERPEAAPR